MGSEGVATDKGIVVIGCRVRDPAKEGWEEGGGRGGEEVEEL